MVAITFRFHLFQSVTQRYKRRKVQEASLQSIQSLWKIQARYQHNHREATSPYHELTPYRNCQRKNWTTKVRQVYDACIVQYVLWWRKGTSQDEVTSCSYIHC